MARKSRVLLIGGRGREAWLGKSTFGPGGCGKKKRGPTLRERYERLWRDQQLSLKRREARYGVRPSLQIGAELVGCVLERVGPNLYLILLHKDLSGLLRTRPDGDPLHVGRYVFVRVVATRPDIELWFRRPNDRERQILHSDDSEQSSHRPARKCRRKGTGTSRSRR